MAHDATFGQSFFHDNEVTVDTEPVVADMTAGVVVQFLHHCQVTYSNTWVSWEFDDQPEWQVYASLSLSIVYDW